MADETFFHGRGRTSARGMRRDSTTESFLMTEQNDRPEFHEGVWGNIRFSVSSFRLIPLR